MTTTTSQLNRRPRSDMALYDIDNAHEVVTIGQNVYVTFRFYFADTDTVSWLTIVFS